MTPYFFKQMRKRTSLCLVVVLTALAFSLALCMLQRSRDQMAARIEEVYDNLEVRCSVTNLTGTQSDRLNLPEGLLRLFTTDITTANSPAPGRITPPAGAGRPRPDHAGFGAESKPAAPAAALPG